MLASEKELRDKIRFLQSLRVQEKQLLDAKYSNTLERIEAWIRNDFLFQIEKK